MERLFVSLGEGSCPLVSLQSSSKVVDVGEVCSDKSPVCIQLS